MIKNFGLSQDRFDTLVADLKRNETEFLEKIFLAHFQECMAYLKREYKANHEDAYDATMETLLAFRKRLVEGKVEYGNLRFLFTKMSTQIYMKNQKSFQIQELNQSESATVEEPLFDDPEHMETLQDCWNDLEAPCQQLLTWHFYGKMRLTEIAEQEQKTSAAIRKQKERCLQKLKQIFRTKSKIHKNE